MLRGEIWWADLGSGAGSAPAYRRPVLIVQSNAFNRSRINTVITAVGQEHMREHVFTNIDSAVIA